MKKILLIASFLLISLNIHTLALEYDGLEKLSKKNTFMDDKGKPYSITEITDKENSFIIIYNHGPNNKNESFSNKFCFKFTI